MNQRNLSAQSEFSTTCSRQNLKLTGSRQRREFQVFKALFKMIPGLQERIMESDLDDGEVARISDLVCAIMNNVTSNLIPFHRSREGYPAQDQTTPKV